MGKKKAERPQCPFHHADCFAWMQGNMCFCLDYTDFKRRNECPFYKNDPNEYDPKYLVEKYREEKT